MSRELELLRPVVVEVNQPVVVTNQVEVADDSDTVLNLNFTNGLEHGLNLSPFYRKSTRNTVFECISRKIIHYQRKLVGCWIKFMSDFEVNSLGGVCVSIPSRILCLTTYSFPLEKTFHIVVY